MTRDKVRAVLRSVRRLLITLLAAWLPLFAGSVAASVVCESHSIGHGIGDHAHAYDQSVSDKHHGDADNDCPSCDSCYSHCTLWISASAGELVAQNRVTAADTEPARLNSLTFPPAHRPPLALQG